MDKNLLSYRAMEQLNGSINTECLHVFYQVLSKVKENSSYFQEEMNLVTVPGSSSQQIKLKHMWV